jgi:hypothetical protein
MNERKRREIGFGIFDTQDCRFRAYLDFHDTMDVRVWVGVEGARWEHGNENPGRMGNLA